MIDPGHGGKDSGAVRGNLREADICLKVSEQLAELLRSDPGFKVILTRDTDVSLPLNKRTEIAAREKADVILSLHANVSDDTEVAGPEFYFQNLLPADEYEQFLANRENEMKSQAQMSGTEEKPSRSWLSARADVQSILNDLHHNYVNKLSAHLAKILHRNWSHQQKRHTKQVRQAPFYLVSNVAAPSALIEMGYLSHPKEGPALANPTYQKEIARDIYRSLLEFKQILDKRTR